MRDKEIEGKRGRKGERAMREEEGKKGRKGQRVGGMEGE